MSALSSLQKRALVACVVGAAFGYSTVGIAVFGQFVGPLVRLTGATPGRVSFAFSTMTLGSMVGPPLAGALIDRWGARWVAVLSALLMAGTFVLLARIETIGAAYILYAAVALCGAGTLATAYSRPIVALFTENRGAALGLMLSAVGIGAGGLPPILNVIIERYGISGGYLTLAAGSVLGIIPEVFLKPETRPVAGTRPLEPRPRAPLMAAVASPNGIKLVILAVLLGLFSAGVWSQAVPLLSVRGLSGAQTAWTMTGVAVIMSASRLLAGVAMDRVFAPIVGVWLLAPVSVAWFVIGAVGSPLVTVVAVLAFGLGLGVEFDLFSYLTSKYVPRAIYASFYGVLYSALAIGLTSGAPLFAYLGSSGGPYAVGAACAAAVAVLLTMSRYAMSEAVDAADAAVTAHA